MSKSRPYYKESEVRNRPPWDLNPQLYVESLLPLPSRILRPREEPLSENNAGVAPCSLDGEQFATDDRSYKLLLSADG